MRHKIGDIVKISKSSAHYSDGERFNPPDIEGKITRINSYVSITSYGIDVRWNNGQSTTYRLNDLRLVKRPN